MRDELCTSLFRHSNLHYLTIDPWYSRLAVREHTNPVFFLLLTSVGNEGLKSQFRHLWVMYFSTGKGISRRTHETSNRTLFLIFRSVDLTAIAPSTGLSS